MDIVTAVLMLLIGLTLGVITAWLVLRARVDARASEQAAQNRAELAQVRGEAAQARAETADVRERAATEQTAIAHARAETAQAQAQAATVGAELAKARAERDAARERAERLISDRESLVAQFKALSAESISRQGEQADVRAEERLKATEQLLRPVAETLERFSTRLATVEKERVAIASDLRNQVQAVQATGEHLRRETQALTTALRKPQQRGAWGELQLKRVVEVSGMVEHCDFTQQHTTSADDKIIRPDMRVDLGGGKCIFVDAKVPMSSFLDAHEAQDDQQRAAALDRFAKNVRTHVDQLGKKRYWQAESGSPEFVILFLPSEALAAAALAQAPDLHAYAAARDVVLATPTTLIATLRAVAYGWKQAALADSAAEVFRLGRELHDRLRAMGGHFQKLGGAIERTVAAYNSTLSSLETRVLVSARRFSDLQVSAEELTTPSPVDTATRRISRAELIESSAAAAPPAISRDALPEAAQLYRADPEISDLVAANDPRTDASETNQATG